MSDSENELTIEVAKDNNDNEYNKSHPSTSKNKEIYKPSNRECLVTATLDDRDGDLSDSSCDSSFYSDDRCAICLGRIKGKLGSPDAEGCGHYFCLLCILEWTKNNPTCPQDRRPFERILVRESIGGEVVSTLQASKSIGDDEEVEVENPTYCEICGSCEREDSLLLCDGCDLGYHLECLTPPLSEVPVEEWFCPLCVAADLPQVVREAEHQKCENQKQKQEKKSKKSNNKKSKAALQRRIRMIPRTRASERVLRRIQRTRGRKQDKYKCTEEDKNEKQVVQLFKRARPFGSIADNDIDAAFNDDEYADRLLSSSTPLSSENKKELAAVKFNNLSSIPLPSYSGRTSHPKLNSSSSDSTDILYNILEEQDVLLSKTKDVSLTKERKLVKKEGAKPLDFNVDCENRIMSELLPSQKKAKETEEKARTEAMEENSGEKVPKEKHENNKDHKRDDDRHYSSYKSKDPTRYPHSSESYRSGYSNNRVHHDSSIRRRDKQRNDYRRDERNHRDRSRNWERKGQQRSYKDSYTHRYRRSRSRSRERDKRRENAQRRRHSRSPVRHSNNRHSSNKRQEQPKASTSFWQNDFIDTFSKNDQKETCSSYHTTEIASCSSQESNRDELKHRNEIEDTAELVISGKGSLVRRVSNSEGRKVLKDNSDSTEEANPHSVISEKRGDTCKKRKVSPSDLSKFSLSENKKNKLKSLFGDEVGSSFEEDTPSSLCVSSADSESAVKEEGKKVLQYLGESYRSPSPEQGTTVSPSSDRGTSPSAFIKDLPNANTYAERGSGSESFSSPPVLPEINCSDDIEDDFDDITTLSKSSRDLILKSLFGSNQTQGDSRSFGSDNYSESCAENNTKSKSVTQDSNLNSSNNTNLGDTKSISPVMDGKSPKAVNSCIERIIDNSEKNKIKFANLFGDLSDSESSTSDFEKKSELKRVCVSKTEHLNSDVNSDVLNPKENPELIALTDSNTESHAGSVHEESHEANNKEEKKPNKSNEISHGTDSKTSVLANKIKVNKLHLEMKVVEETKKFLYPYYKEKGFSKQIYKEIVSKCVNKVLDVECGSTVDPKKIQKLVDGYVQVYMHRNKKSSSQPQSDL